jgi:hypothetical protein
MGELPQTDWQEDFVVNALPEDLRLTEEAIREEFGSSSAFDRPELVRYTDENGTRRELILPSLSEN